MLFWWLFLTITCLSNLLVGVGFSKVENISDISFLVARRPLLWHQPTTMPRAGPAFPLGLKRLVKSIPGSIEAGLEAYGGPAPVLLRHLMFFFKARMQSELERLNLKYRLRRNSLVFAKIVNKDTTRGQDLIEAQRGWFINTKQGLRASVNRCLEPREESYHWISPRREASFECSQSEKTAGGNGESRFWARCSQLRDLLWELFLQICPRALRHAELQTGERLKSAYV